MKKFLVILAVVIVLGLAGGAVYLFVFAGYTIGDVELRDPDLDNRFGFLGGGPTLVPFELSEMNETGAGWVRPHPGPFIWGSMQPSADAEIDFRDSDKMMRLANKHGLSVLVTLWPYAEWDQQTRADSADCDVGFVEFSEEFGNFRCVPNDWQAYEAWVTAVVERYDGDGIDDMSGLGVKIKHWEASNEPDLNYRAKAEPGSEDKFVPGVESRPDDSNLTFFEGEPEEYAELLKRTYKAVKAADQSAQVLIAGSAGGSDDSAAFYRKIFSDPGVLQSFDIANVHCISSDDVQSFNVEPYNKLLQEFKITAPVWVTEAEAFIAKDDQVNATQVEASSRKAFRLGAERIFYTSRNFEAPPGIDIPIKIDEMWKFIPPPDRELEGATDDPIGTYQIIFTALQEAAAAQ
ncbi:hypothetical protein ACFL2M_01145 [Patescibacteria group bacterium]